MNQRGIRIIAAVHGGSLPMLLHDPERAALAGGCHTVLLSGEEANRRKVRVRVVGLLWRAPSLYGDCALVLVISPSVG